MLLRDTKYDKVLLRTTKFSTCYKVLQQVRPRTTKYNYILQSILLHTAKHYSYDSHSTCSVQGMQKDMQPRHAFLILVTHETSTTLRGATYGMQKNVTTTCTLGGGSV